MKLIIRLHNRIKYTLFEIIMKTQGTTKKKNWLKRITVLSRLLCNTQKQRIANSSSRNTCVNEDKTRVLRQRD